MVINMGRFEKRFSRFFPHLQIVLSLPLIIQWILLLFNPNLGLLNLNDPLSALYLLCTFVLLFAGGLYSWLCRKNTPFLPAGMVFSLLLLLQWILTKTGFSELLSVSDLLCCIELIFYFLLTLLEGVLGLKQSSDASPD